MLDVAASERLRVRQKRSCMGVWTEEDISRPERVAFHSSSKNDLVRTYAVLAVVDTVRSIHTSSGATVVGQLWRVSFVGVARGSAVSQSTR